MLATQNLHSDPTSIARVEPLACNKAESLPLWSMHATRTITLPKEKEAHRHTHATRTITLLKYKAIHGVSCIKATVEQDIHFFSEKPQRLTKICQTIGESAERQPI